MPAPPSSRPRRSIRSRHTLEVRNASRPAARPLQHPERRHLPVATAELSRRAHATPRRSPRTSARARDRRRLLDVHPAGVDATALQSRSHRTTITHLAERPERAEETITGAPREPSSTPAPHDPAPRAGRRAGPIRVLRPVRTPRRYRRSRCRAIRSTCCEIPDDVELASPPIDARSPSTRSAAGCRSPAAERASRARDVPLRFRRRPRRRPVRPHRLDRSGVRAGRLAARRVASRARGARHRRAGARRCDRGVERGARPHGRDCAARQRHRRRSRGAAGARRPDPGRFEAAHRRGRMAGADEPPGDSSRPTCDRM